MIAVMLSDRVCPLPLTLCESGRFLAVLGIMEARVYASC